MKKNLVTFFVQIFVRSTLFAFVMSLIAMTLMAQTPAPTPNSERAELSKVEAWALSQGDVESIAPEIAAILGLGSDRLPVKVKSFRASDGVSQAFAVTTLSLSGPDALTICAADTRKTCVSTK